jgi:long-subunit fatty acid transport protein
MDSGTTQTLYGVWGRSGKDVFAVGTYGTILHYNGSGWAAMDSGTTEFLMGVWASSNTYVFAVGNSGTILRYNGNTWTLMNSGTTEQLRDVWGSSDTDVFAVGDNGTILRYNGNTWTLMNSGTTEQLRDVWGSSDTDVFAVGDNGTIVHYNGYIWTTVNSGTTELLEGVWGSSDTDVFAVGDNGTIVHYNGRTWNEMDSGTTETLSSIWGASGDDVFSTSDLGTIIHFGGGSWAVIKPGGKHYNSVTDLEFHRKNTSVVYASTLLAGVYVSPNQARNWLNLGTPDFDVNAISTSSLYAATEGGLLKCTGTGVVAGLVTDAPTGKGIDHASVYTDLGNKTSSIAGEYMMVCPAGIFNVTAIADNHANKTIKNVTVSGGDVSWELFSMEAGNPAPLLSPAPQDTSSGSSYCFITTAAYGSPLAKQVKVLRQFRNRYLLTHTIGQKLVALYYREGKPAAMYIESHPWLKFPIRVLLYPLVGLAWLLVSTSAKTKGIICLCILIGGMVIIRRRQTKRKNVKESASGHAINIMLALFFFILIFEVGSLQAATLFQNVGIASSPNPVGSGARAVGMGGAFIGIADDATAASWNPAGLIQLERPELSIVGDYNYRKEEFTSSSHPEIDNTGRVDEVALNYFSATYPFHLYRNMVVSINYQRLYDFKQNFDYRYDYSFAGLDLEQYKSFSQDGSVGALGLAAAVEITPKLSLGVTLNIWTDQLLWENGWDEYYTEHGVGTLGGVSAIIDTRIHDKYSQFRGVNANFGLLWHITKPLTIGAVVKTPFTASLLHEFSSGETQTIGGSTTVLPSIYQKEDVELDMPMSYGIGIAWRFSDAFSIDIDVYRTLWSKYILTDDQGNEFSPIDGRPKSQSQVKDTTQVRIGGEYLFIKQNMNMVIPVRAGFFYDPQPSEGSPEDFFGFAIGSGIAYKQFIFDVAYQFRWGNDVDTGNLIATSKADITQHTLLASIIFHF